RYQGMGLGTARHSQPTAPRARNQSLNTGTHLEELGQGAARDTALPSGKYIPTDSLRRSPGATPSESVPPRQDHTTHRIPCTSAEVVRSLLRSTAKHRSRSSLEAPRSDLALLLTAWSHPFLQLDGG